MVRRALDKLLAEGNLNPSYSYQFNARANKRSSESVKGSQVSRKASEEQLKGIPATPDSKSASSAGQHKCLSADTHSMESKQEKLETHTGLQGCDLVDTT